MNHANNNNNKINNNTANTTGNNNGQNVVNNGHVFPEKITLKAPNPICELNNTTPFINYNTMTNANGHANINTNIINNDNHNSNMFGLSTLNALNTNMVNNNNKNNDCINDSSTVTPKLTGMQGKNDAGVDTNAIYMKDKVINRSIIPTDAFGRLLHPCMRVYGNCNFGDDCRFACYPFNSCLNHIKGKCHHGNTCKEVHVDPTTP